MLEFQTFALQKYNKFFIYANNGGFFCFLPYEVNKKQVRGFSASHLLESPRKGFSTYSLFYEKTLRIPPRSAGCCLIIYTSNV